jgi:hypothetical protein
MFKFQSVVMALMLQSCVGTKQVDTSEDNTVVPQDMFVTGSGFGIHSLISELESNGHTIAIAGSSQTLLSALTLVDGVYQYKTVLLFEPAESYTEEEVAAVQEFVNQGNRVTMFVNSARNVEPLLHAYGMDIPPIGITDANECYLYDTNTFADPQGDFADGVTDVVFFDAHQLETGIPVQVDVDAEDPSFGEEVIFDATPIALSRTDQQPLAAVVANEAGGEFIVVADNQFMVDQDPEFSQSYTSGLYLFDNCQFALNAIRAGVCSVDSEGPEFRFLYVRHGEDHNREIPDSTEFTDPNGEYRINVQLQDDRGVWRAVYRINGEGDVEMFNYPGCSDRSINIHPDMPRNLKFTDSRNFLAGTSIDIFIKDLNEGENIIEVTAYDGSNNASTESITVTKQTFPPPNSGRILFQGLVADQEGLAASGSGHAMPSGLSEVVFNVDTETCSAGTAAPAFYSIQTRDNVETSFRAGAHALSINSGFSALSEATSNNVNELTLHFGELNLGADVQGEDWDRSGNTDTETRRYSNPGDTDFDGACEPGTDCTKLELHWEGNPMLEATMGSVFLTLDHNESHICGDDFIRVVTSTMTDLALAENASGSAVDIGNAMLQDIGAEGVCLRLADTEPIVRTSGDFNIQNGTLDIGPCE